jgi:hypothetical protein
MVILKEKSTHNSFKLPPHCQGPPNDKNTLHKIIKIEKKELQNY